MNAKHEIITENMSSIRNKMINSVNEFIDTTEVDKNSNLRTSRTIYINNLDEKIPATELKKTLNETFSRFGKIESIKCFRSFYRRGQAWILFGEFDSAEKAIKANGTYLFGKPIKVVFAIEDSKNNTNSKDKATKKTPMIPKSIKARIELYKLYLHQWLKHVRTNGLLENMLELSRNKQDKMHYNPILWDNNFLNRKNDLHFKGVQNHFSLIPKVNLEYDQFIKRKADSSIDSLLIKKNNKIPNILDNRSSNNTVLVQIIGSCKEEELYNVFKNTSGYKELRFVSVSLLEKKINKT